MRFPMCNWRTNIAKKQVMAKIILEYGERKVLGEIFNVSQLTIRRALSCKTNTDLAIKIRKVALDRGGVLKPNQNPTQQ